MPLSQCIYPYSNVHPIISSYPNTFQYIYSYSNTLHHTPAYSTISQYIPRHSITVHYIPSYPNISNHIQSFVSAKIFDTCQILIFQFTNFQYEPSFIFLPISLINFPINTYKYTYKYTYDTLINPSQDNRACITIHCTFPILPKLSNEHEVLRAFPR